MPVQIRLRKQFAAESTIGPASKLGGDDIVDDSIPREIEKYGVIDRL